MLSKSKKLFNRDANPQLGEICGALRTTDFHCTSYLEHPSQISLNFYIRHAVQTTLVYLIIVQDGINVQAGKIPIINKRAGWNKAVQVGIFHFLLVKIKVLA